MDGWVRCCFVQGLSLQHGICISADRRSRFTLIPRLDWRVIEVSYQRGPGDNLVNVQTGILSTGIVVHF